MLNHSSNRTPLTSNENQSGIFLQQFEGARYCVVKVPWPMTATRSPGLNDATLAPQLVTTPEHSRPNDVAGRDPWAMNPS